MEAKWEISVVHEVGKNGPLSQGWEPFAVDNGLIYFRRRLYGGKPRVSTKAMTNTTKDR